MNKAIMSFCLPGALLLSGCALNDARHEQCGRPDFLYCLGARPEQCDQMFDKANVECNAKMEENSMFANMPDNMKQNYTNRCIVGSLVAQSGKEEDKVKGCIRW